MVRDSELITILRKASRPRMSEGRRDWRHQPLLSPSVSGHLPSATTPDLDRAG